jgi:hypothetical protein
MLVGMSDPNREADRLPIGIENQSIDQWAQHGVEELTERAAEEQAELGVPAEEASDG